MLIKLNWYTIAIKINNGWDQEKRGSSIMEFLKNNVRGIIIALLAVGVITAVSVSNSNDDDQTENQPEVSQADTSQDQNTGPVAPETEEESETSEESSAFNESGERESATVEAAEGTFTTIARDGDNQTTLVRDIIAQYMDNQDTELSAEQMLYVETNLVKDLPKSDLIFVGDEVTVSEADLEATVTAANELTEAQLALWAQYL